MKSIRAETEAHRDLMTLNMLAELYPGLKRKQLEQVTSAPGSVQEALAEQLALENEASRKKRLSIRDRLPPEVFQRLAHTRKRGLYRKTRERVVKNFERTEQTIQNLEGLPSSLLADGEAETYREACVIVRRRRRRELRERYLPRDRACPCCGVVKVNSKAWTVLAGRSFLVRIGEELRAKFFAWWERDDDLSVTAVCRVCWESFKKETCRA